MVGRILHRTASTVREVYRGLSTRVKWSLILIRIGGTGQAIFIAMRKILVRCCMTSAIVRGLGIVAGDRLETPMSKKRQDTERELTGKLSLRLV